MKHRSTPEGDEQESDRLLEAVADEVDPEAITPEGDEGDIDGYPEGLITNVGGDRGDEAPSG